MIELLVWLQLYIFGTFVALAIGNATSSFMLKRTHINDVPINNESTKLTYVVVMTLSSWLGIALFVIGLFIGAVGYFINRGKKQ